MKRRYPSTDMTKCQHQPQFGCWPGAGLAVGAVALAALHSLPAWPLALAEPNAEPSNSGQEQGLAQGRASAGQLGACRCSRWARAQAEHTLDHQGSSELQVGARRGAGPPSEDTTPMRNPRQGTEGRYQQLEHAAAAAQGTQDEPRNSKHTGLSLTNFVSVDTGNANRESTEVGMQEYVILEIY